MGCGCVICSGPPPPGPDGLPSLLKLPRRPRGADFPWCIETRGGWDEAGREWSWVVLANESRLWPRTDEDPSFLDHDETMRAALRSAARLGTYLREK